MKLISKSIVPKGTYTPVAIILLIITLYFFQQVESVHMAFLTPDIINIYPIYLVNYTPAAIIHSTYDNANYTFY